MGSTVHSRIRERLAALEMTPNEASRRAGLSRDYLRKALERGTSVRAANAVRLADVLGVTPQWLLTGETPALEPPRRRLEPTEPDQSRKPARTVRLPVYGLAAASPLGKLAFTPEPIEWVAAPERLASVRGAYALIVTGASMQPRYDPGDMVFLHPHQPPRPGDDIAIQEALDGGVAVSLKRFVKWEDGHLVAEQFNPPATVRYSRAALMAVHRVLSRNELVEI